MRLLPAFLALLLSGPALAHPHIFVDTGLKLDIDPQGNLRGIEVAWAYDEMYSMLLLDDMGLDPDYDGVLTDAEMAQLDGFDMNWIKGFEGDLYVRHDGRPVVLGPPEPRGTEFEGAKVLTHHYRPLVTPLPADGLVIKAFDPGFYTGYDLTMGVQAGPRCRTSITRPKADEAYRALQSQLAALPPEATDYPQVGETFAETVTLSCQPGS